MIPFLTALPLATKITTATIAFTAVFGFGMYVGHKWGDSACKDAVIEAQRHGMEIAERQTVVTEKVVVKYVDRIKIVEKRSQEIKNAIPNFVKNDDNPMLPGGFRVWHDAASQNEIPDPTRVADAPIVAAGIVAETVGRNYGAFYKNKEQLDALQQWVKDQLIIK
jgi:hypothetical protein